MFPNKDANVNGVVVDVKIGNNIEMLRTFVLSQVVPQIRRCIPELAFLWFIYSDDAVSEKFLPEEFKNQIKMELNEILTASDVDVEVNNFNPIR